MKLGAIVLPVSKANRANTVHLHQASMDSNPNTSNNKVSSSTRGLLLLSRRVDMVDQGDREATSHKEGTVNRKVVILKEEVMEDLEHPEATVPRPHHQDIEGENVVTDVI